MLDSFIEKIPFGVDENRFLLVNTIFKRIKQLSQKNVEKLNPLTSDEIVDRAYKEIKSGEVKPIIKENVIKEEKVKKRKKLKEIAFTEKPSKTAKAKAKKSSKTKSRK